MVSYIDREAGFAVFRQGRSACIRLAGTLDMEMARGIARQIRTDHDSVRLRLECSTLRSVQPEAARTLAHAVLLWGQRRDDRSVDILNLDRRLHHTLAWHPLRSVTETDAFLFFDPEAEPRWLADPDTTA